MKLNIIKVLNEIAAADATVVMLNDPDAVWNLPNNDEALYEAYECYKHDTEYSNSDILDIIEWNEKHGYDYSNWLKYLKNVLTFEEWLANENKMRANYMVTSVCPNCSFNCYVREDVVNKMINTVNNNHRNAVELFIKIMAA